MRIIAGEFRGRKLLAPMGTQTRPITDRAKQSLFDILAPAISGSRVYDCFAGTGSLGLECLSRGARHVTFFESDRSAAALLRKNIDMLGVTNRCAVIKQDLFGWFRANKANAGLVDLVFLDPPYRYVRDRTGQLREAARRIASMHLSADGVVVFRHDARDRLELPELVRYDQREFGSMTIEFLQIRGDGDSPSH